MIYCFFYGLFLLIHTSDQGTSRAKGQSPEDEGSYAPQLVGLALEHRLLYLQNEAVFGFGFGLTEAGDDGGAGLEEVHAGLLALVDLGEGFVLVGPYH